MKTAIITGTSQGLGQVLAKTFLAAGWNVIGTGRSPKPEGLEAAIAYHQFDASDAAACDGFFKSLAPERKEGEVCLVNNAGGYVGGDLLGSASEDYGQQLASIYLTTAYMTKALASHVPKARIFNVVSATALAPDPSDLAYGAAKAAQRYFVQALQQDAKLANYRITNLYPDWIASHGPNPRAIDPQDLADLIAQLAASQASYYMKDITVCSAGQAD